MCMSSVKQKFVRDNNFGIGFKKMQKSGAQYVAPIQGGVYEVGKWLKANTKETISADSGEDYKAGFHIFLSEKDAQDYNMTMGVVVRVRYRKVTAYGKNEVDYHSKGNCVIASEMFIEKHQ